MAPDGERKPTLEDVEMMLHDLRASMTQKTEVRATERLILVRLLMLGYGMGESCHLLDISTSTGYAWKSAWDRDGVDSVFPHYGGGRRPVLDRESMSKAADEIAKLRMTTAEAREYLREEYGVNYSAKHVSVRLRELGLRHVRPYEMEFESEEEEAAVLNGSSEMRWIRRGSLYGWRDRRNSR